MKDSLKEFVDKNREAFDDMTPGNQVWNKIEPYLPKMKVVSLWNSVMLWRVAAVLFMGLSIVLFLTGQEKSSKKNLTAQLQGEFLDVEAYYQGEIAKKVALIGDFGGKFEKDQFTQDFEKLDAMYQVLRGELKDHPNDKLKDALILNTLVRIDLLNQQINRLENLRKEKRRDNASV